MTSQKKQLKEHAKELIQTQRSFIESLIALRESSGLTQKQLATRMGVSQSAVSLFENDDSNPTLSSIRRYALGVNAELVMQVKARPIYTAETVVRKVVVQTSSTTTIRSSSATTIKSNEEIPWPKNENHRLENA